MRRACIALVGVLAALGLFTGCVPDPVSGGGTTTTTTPVDPDRLFDAYYLLEVYFGLTSDQSATDCIANGLARDLSDDILGSEGDLRGPGDWLPADDDAFVGVVNGCITPSTRVEWASAHGFIGILQPSERSCVYSAMFGIAGGAGEFLHGRASEPPDWDIVAAPFDAMVGCVGEATAAEAMVILFEGTDLWGLIQDHECTSVRYVEVHGVDSSVTLVASVAHLGPEHPVPAAVVDELVSYDQVCGGW